MLLRLPASRRMQRFRGPKSGFVRLVPRAILLMSAASLLSDCAKPNSALIVTTTPIEAALRDVFDAINAGNAAHIFPLVSARERDAEGLTQRSLQRLLDVFRRETAGAARGQMVTEGSPGAMGGTVLYKSHGSVVTVLVINMEMADSGRPSTFLLTWSLVSSAAIARGRDGSNIFAGGGAVQRAALRGLEALKPELRSAGPRLIYHPPPQTSLTLDEEIVRMGKRIEMIEARKPAVMPKAAG